jgi:DNA-binding response OmpR family regulator
VYAHVKNLKRKLTEAGAANYIRMVYGLGYRFDVSEG